MTTFYAMRRSDNPGLYYPGDWIEDHGDLDSTLHFESEEDARSYITKYLSDEIGKWQVVRVTIEPA